MNIKEIEEKTGLDRATVRYYEAQGLLSPTRHPNGYRDYGQEELTTLRRIRILRQVGMSLEEIGRVQRREEPLSEAAGRRLKALEREAQEKEDQTALCRRLTSAQWDTLDDTILAGRETASPPPVRERVAGHPYRRLLARILDLLLCAPLPWYLFCQLVRSALESGDSATTGPLLFFATLVLGFGTELIEVVYEAAALTLTGTTVGKYLMGVFLENRDGGRPAWNDAGRRAMEVYFPTFDDFLERWRINGIFLYMDWIEKCEKGKDLPWEDDLFLYVRYEKEKKWKWALYVAVLAAILMALALIWRDTLMFL